jgi:hypothetical protein
LNSLVTECLHVLAGIHSRDEYPHQLYGWELASEMESTLKSDAPWKGHLPAVGVNAPDLVHVPTLE